MGLHGSPSNREETKQVITDLQLDNLPGTGYKPCQLGKTKRKETAMKKLVLILALTGLIAPFQILAERPGNMECNRGDMPKHESMEQGQLPPPNFCPPQCMMQGPKFHQGHQKQCNPLIAMCFLAHIFAVCFLIHVLLSVWVYRDIKKRKTGSGIWIVIVLLTGLIGVIPYAIVRIGDNRQS